MIRRATAGVLLLAMATTAIASDPVTYRVEKVRRNEVREFIPEGDRFVRGRTISQDVLVGSQIIEVSSRGYLRVQTANGPVWLDRLDVQIEPKLPLKAICVTAVSSAIDTTSGIVRGAGEGCP